MKLTLLAAALWIAQAHPAPVQKPDEPPPSVPQLDQKRLLDLGAEQILPFEPKEGQRRYRPIMLPDRQDFNRG